jgi:hypothetical protein
LLTQMGSVKTTDGAGTEHDDLHQRTLTRGHYGGERSSSGRPDWLAAADGDRE